MPEISRFYGIVIQIYYGDHPPPHFHALYAGEAAKVDIETLAVIDGRLPARALGLVIEWATGDIRAVRRLSRRTRGGVHGWRLTRI